MKYIKSYKIILFVSFLIITIFSNCTTDETQTVITMHELVFQEEFNSQKVKLNRSTEELKLRSNFHLEKEFGQLSGC